MTLSFVSPAQQYLSPPAAPAPTAPTSARGLANEWRTALLPPLLLARTPKLLRAPRGTGGTVIDIPGWKSPEASMAPLRRYLRNRGHNARGWGLGTNTGDPERDAEIMSEIVAAHFDRTGETVALVGWSLGGVIARETARNLPHAVRRVITYGTPVVGGPTYTLGAGSYGHQENARISAMIEDLDQTNPIQVPITAFFTRQDRVVSWPACIDRASLDVEHIEVTSTHVGMGFDPYVWEIVARRLAA